MLTVVCIFCLSYPFVRVSPKMSLLRLRRNDPEVMSIRFNQWCTSSLRSWKTLSRDGVPERILWHGMATDASVSILCTEPACAISRRPCQQQRKSHGPLVAVTLEEWRLTLGGESRGNPWCVCGHIYVSACMRVDMCSNSWRGRNLCW